MRLTTLIVVLTFVMSALTLALAQKGDRLPDPDTPKVVRTISITPSFDQRWFGPAASDRWLSNQPPPSDKFTPWPPTQRVEAQTQPTTSLGAPVPIPRAKKLAQDTRPAQVLCTRHGMRTVWQGQSWRCRK